MWFSSNLHDQISSIRIYSAFLNVVFNELMINVWTRLYQCTVSLNFFSIYFELLNMQYIHDNIQITVNLSAGRGRDIMRIQNSS